MDPVKAMYDEEISDIIVAFCSYVCICFNKKLNLPNIFILLLKDERYLDCFKTLTDIDNSFEALKYFLEVDSSLHKSKYIKKFLSIHGDEINF
jgi:hypothetical protein